MVVDLNLAFKRLKAKNIKLNPKNVSSGTKRDVTWLYYL
jgi:hypothetical protein